MSSSLTKTGLIGT